MKRFSPDIGPVLTMKELCNYLKISSATVYRLLKAGQLPAFKIGSDWRFNSEEIDAWRLEREGLNSACTLAWDKSFRQRRQS
jgi:excisionase family DNA binding protein